MRVKATKECFVGGARRREGAVFHVNSLSGGEDLPSYLEKADEPVTESEVLQSVVPGQAPRPGAPPVDPVTNPEAALASSADPAPETPVVDTPAAPGTEDASFLD